MSTRTTLADLTNIIEEAQFWTRQATGDSTIVFQLKQGSMTRGIRWGMVKVYAGSAEADVLRAGTKSELWETINGFASAARLIARNK